MSQFSVIPITGKYLVIDQRTLKIKRVYRDGRCSCGGDYRGQSCLHVEAVKAHVERGGARAPEARELPQTHEKLCPICGSPIVEGGYRVQSRVWGCSADLAHYFVWFNEQGGDSIRKFLTEPHPNKVGAFYGQSKEELEAFRSAAEERIKKWMADRE